MNNHDIICIRDMINSLLFPKGKGQRPKGGTIRMNKYELALVVNAKIEDDARAAVVEKAKDYITRAEGTVTEVEDWGKKKLAYEIKKNNEAIYMLINFESKPEAIAELERNYRITDEILKFIVVRKEN